MNDVYQTSLDSLNLSMGSMNLSAAAAEKTAPQKQLPGLPGISVQGMPGFMKARPGTYEVYRGMSGHPTISLVMGMVKAPIVGNSWRWTRRDKRTKTQWL